MPQSMPMSAQPPSADTAPGPLEPAGDSAISALQRAMIGPLNATHYLPVFARFEADDRAGPGWNWAASLCTLNWMVFRRLWGPALAYLGCIAAGLLLVFGLGRLVLQLSPSGELSLLVSLATIAVLVPGGLGDAWLYRQYRARSAAALVSAPTLQEACALLARQASSRRRLLGIAILNLLLAAAVASAWLAWNHRTRMPAAMETARSAVGQITPEPAVPGSSAPLARVSSGSGAAIAPAVEASAPRATPTSAPEAAASVASAGTADAVAALPASAAASSAALVTTVLAPATPASSEASTPVADTAPTWYTNAAAMRAYAPRRSPQPSAAEAPTASASAVAPAPTLAASEAAPRRETPIAAKRPVANAPVPTPVAKTSQATAPSGNGAYAINIGLYAQPANAQRVLATLREAGVRTMVQELDMPNGKRTRVRAGPFANRAQADAAAARIRAAGLEAVVARE